MNHPIFVACLSSIWLAACSGGNNDGPPGSTSNPFPFRSFSAVPPDQTTRLSGTVQGVSVTDVDDQAAFEPTRTDPASVDLNAARNPEERSLVIRHPGQTDIVFTADDDPRETFRGFLWLYKDRDSQAFDEHDGLAFIAVPENTGQDFQSYGAWIVPQSEDRFFVNAGSFGAETATSNIPVGTIATFRGDSVGLYIRNDGLQTWTDSIVTVTTDFRSATLQSADTFMYVIPSGMTRRAEELDFSAEITNLNRGDGTGIVLTDRLSGTVLARFYGPNAEEIGGSWALIEESFSERSQYVAGFGARR